MSDTITLTRAQWNEVFDGLDQIRATYDCLSDTAVALTVLGLDKPAGTITAVQDEIGNEVNRLQSILITADDRAWPEKLDFCWDRIWSRLFWPLRKSTDREA